jgi:lysyl-tRNA synthetase class 2
MRSFLPTARLETLQQRALLLRQVREFFDRREFWEVETPLLSSDTVIDRHLDPFAVTVSGSHSSGDADQIFWLQTSPEFGMKRLLAAGAHAIYQITRAFRRDELGRLHNPEFTMVEWYRCGDTLQDGMQLLSDLADTTLGRGAAQRRSYRDLFESAFGINPHRASCELLRQVAARHAVTAPDSYHSADVDAWLDLLLTERIQPTLGMEHPVIVYDYPASQSALARIRPDDDPVAERFELYVDGIELANGYHELLDAEELIARQRRTNELRAAEGKPKLPEQNRLIEAMQHGIPPCTGVALGLDRLMLVSIGAHQLADVLAFPFDRA